MACAALTDAGPWPCAEDGCPSPSVSCATLSEHDFCEFTFDAVWDAPPPAVAGRQILELCARSCGECYASFFELPRRAGAIAATDAPPTAAEFVSAYASGWGRPLLLRGAARSMPAYARWQDDAELVARFGDVLLQAEYARKETRTARTSKLRLREFVDSYRQTDVHLVSFLPPEMQADVLLPPFLSCRPHAAHLDTHNLWWSAGNRTRSVLHNDDQDNLNCVLAGRKRFVFFHPREKPTIETDAFGWVNADGDRSLGYGGFGGRLDVERIDLRRFGGWRDLEWWEADLEAGDCVFIPTAWYHHVASDGERNLAVNVWWWRRDVDADDSLECAEADAPPVSWANCSWGYDGPPPGPAARASAAAARDTTRCAGVPEPAARRHAGSWITTWQRASLTQAAAALQSGVDRHGVPLPGDLGRAPSHDEL